MQDPIESKVLTLNIIGGGKVAKTLARLWFEQNLVRVHGVCNTQRINAEKAVAEIGSGYAVAKLAELQPADMTLIATPDDRIAEIVAETMAYDFLTPGAVVFHCSGILPAAVLSPLREKQCVVASMHPLKSFSMTSPRADNLNQTICAYEGDEAAFPLLEKLFSSIGALVIQLASDRKVYYHAAAVIASNYMVTIAHYAKQCWELAGLEAPISQELVVKLMSSTLENLTHSRNIVDALTGPIARGDKSIIEHHLLALEPFGWLRDCYLALGRLTLSLSNNQTVLENVFE